MTLEDFEIKEKIGEGSFGEIFKVIKKSNQKIYAMKVIDKKKIEKKKMVDNIITECNILLSVNHPNLIKCADHFETEDSFIFVMKYYSK